MKNYLSIIIIGIFITGCATNTRQNVKVINQNVMPVPTAKALNTKKEMEKISLIPIQPKESYLPSWITNTNKKEGYMCNIGSCILNSNMAITKKVAIIQAKANISQDISSYVETQRQLQENCKNDECKSKFTSRTKITSAQIIRNVKITNSFTDTKEKIYYIQICSKI